MKMQTYTRPRSIETTIETDNVKIEDGDEMRAELLIHTSHAPEGGHRSIVSRQRRGGGVVSMAIGAAHSGAKLAPPAYAPAARHSAKAMEKAHAAYLEKIAEGGEFGTSLAALIAWAEGAK